MSRPGKGRPNITHGLTRGGVPRAYNVWRMMIARCTKPTEPAYKNYGARGIKVCRRWMKYENFLADMGGPPPGLTLERKNVNGNYCKSNCEWATRTVQNRNQRRAQKVRWKGRMRSVFDLAEEHGLVPNTVVVRLARGWTVERALITKPLTRKQCGEATRDARKICHAV